MKIKRELLSLLLLLIPASLCAAEATSFELHPPPISIESGQQILMVGSVAVSVLLMICAIYSLRAQRFRYSLLGLFGFCLALSVSVMGAVRWHQAIEVAKSEEWVALIDGNLLRRQDVDKRSELLKRLNEFKALNTKQGIWTESVNALWNQSREEAHEHALKKVLAEYLMSQAAQRAGMRAKSFVVRDISVWYRDVRKDLTVEERAPIAQSEALALTYRNWLRETATIRDSKIVALPHSLNEYALHVEENRVVNEWFRIALRQNRVILFYNGVPQGPPWDNFLQGN